MIYNLYFFLDLCTKEWSYSFSIKKHPTCSLEQSYWQFPQKHCHGWKFKILLIGNSHRNTAMGESSKSFLLAIPTETLPWVKVQNSPNPSYCQFPQKHCHGWICSKFPKYWTFRTPILKLAVCTLNIHFKVHRQTENKSEKLIWSPKCWLSVEILNSGIILKTFTNALQNE